jgi:hypothetical protein
MQLEQLLHAQNIITTIKQLNSEITELKNFAMQLINSNQKGSHFEFKIPTGNLPKERTQEEIYQQRAHEWMNEKRFSDIPPTYIEPEFHLLKQNLTQETMLRILQLMLDEKLSMRSMLEVQLSQMGVKF